jgi:S-DNA-T family DNA segregation ATPase FtsK/SpoIIIE
MSFDEMIENGAAAGEEDAELLEAAVQIIRETRRASTSSLQRRLRIGYTRAARIMDVLEERGIVGPARGSDPREILIDLTGEMADNAARPEEDQG